MHGSWEIPCSPTAGHRQRDAWGSLRTGAYDERTREVGQTHTTWEVSEQSQIVGGGGDGGKGSGQGKPEPAKRIPDTEPEPCAQCAGSGTTSGKKEQA